MAAEITVWFENIDIAEHAARQLRQRGRGIRSLRIRQPRKRENTDAPMWSALALYATPLGESYLSGGGVPSAGVTPAFFSDTDVPKGSELRKREDCLMILVSEDGTAKQNAALLTALHGSHLQMTPRLPADENRS